MCSKNALYGETDREVNVLTELKKKRRKRKKKKVAKKKKEPRLFTLKVGQLPAAKTARSTKQKQREFLVEKKKEKKRSTETTNW